MFSHIREPINGLTHYLAGLVALVGLIVLLVVGGTDEIKLRSLLVYGASLVLMMMASSAYHMLPGKPSQVKFLRKLDHAAIFILIAGTYTPLCLNLFMGFWRWGVFSLIWLIAITGIILKVFVISKSNWVNVSLYLAMGWVSIIGVREIWRVLPPGALFWLVSGGAAFTIGALVYAFERPNLIPGVLGFHELWHIFVIVGCLCHYFMILFFVAPIERVL